MADGRAPWLHLAGAAVGAWFTKQAIRPVELPSWRAVPSFFAGWLTNELVLHHMAWQTAATLGWVRAGTHRTWQGKAALTLTAAQWVALAAILRGTLASREAVREAVEDAFGGVDPLEHLVLPGAEWPRWGQLALPLPPRHPDVERTRGNRFHRAGGTDIELDVYRHRDRPTGCPVILYVHGGAWVFSNRNHQGLPLMQEMAARGWVGVNADYRLAPWATFPEQLVDVKRAVAWIRAHADDIGADPEMIAISGGSAGGHLAALAALTANDPRFQPGFEDEDTRVQACVPFYGVYDVTGTHRGEGRERFVRFFERYVMKARLDDEPDRFADASPITHVGPDAPPFLVIHGELDNLAPLEGARAFVERLREVGDVPVGYAELPCAQHAFDVFPSLRTAYVLRGVADFLARACRWQRDRGEPSGATGDAAGVTVDGAAGRGD